MGSLFWPELPYAASALAGLADSIAASAALERVRPWREDYRICRGWPL